MQALTFAPFAIYLLKMYEYPHFPLDVLEQNIDNRCKSPMNKEKLWSKSDQGKKGRFFGAFDCMLILHLQ